MSEILGGGTPAYAKGEKATIYNAILEIAADIDARGSAPSRWRGSEEFTTCATEYGRSDQCFGNGDPTGLTLETPFGSNSALIRLRTDQAHPQLKNGLLITVQIPFWSTPAEVTNEAAFLNFWEARSWTDFPQFGCWHLYLTGNDKAGLAHTSFVPNALYLDNLVFNLALWSVARAQWVRRERSQTSRISRWRKFLTRASAVDGRSFFRIQPRSLTDWLQLRLARANKLLADDNKRFQIKSRAHLTAEPAAHAKCHGACERGAHLLGPGGA